MLKREALTDWIDKMSEVKKNNNHIETADSKQSNLVSKAENCHELRPTILYKCKMCEMYFTEAVGVPALQPVQHLWHFHRLKPEFLRDIFVEVPAINPQHNKNSDVWFFTSTNQQTYYIIGGGSRPVS